MLYNLVNKEKVSVNDGVGNFQGYNCDRKGCNNFTTNDYDKFNEHCAGHDTIQGARLCFHCGGKVELKDHPNTHREVAENKVFHKKCRKEFLKE